MSSKIIKRKLKFEMMIDRNLDKLYNYVETVYNHQNGYEINFDDPDLIQTMDEVEYIITTIRDAIDELEKTFEYELKDYYKQKSQE